MLHLLDSVSTRSTSPDQQKCSLEFLALYWRQTHETGYPHWLYIQVPLYCLSKNILGQWCTLALAATAGSRRGIVTDFSGATLDLPITKGQ